MSRRDEPPAMIELEASVVHSTPDAYLLDVDGGRHWVPRSQCVDCNDGTFLIAEWLAKQKGMI